MQKQHIDTIHRQIDRKHKEHILIYLFLYVYVYIYIYISLNGKITGRNTRAIFIYLYIYINRYIYIYKQIIDGSDQAKYRYIDLHRSIDKQNDRSMVHRQTDRWKDSYALDIS